MLVQFNLIDRKENKISIEAEEGTTIKDAIMLVILLFVEEVVFVLLVMFILQKKI